MHRQPITVNRVAQQAAYARRQQLPRSRILRPAPAAWAQVIEELLQEPPTVEELHLLTEVAREAEEQDLEPEEIEARLRDTRLWKLYKFSSRSVSLLSPSSRS